MSSDVEVQIAVDYVCALAETLLCLQCKKLPKKAHHCINCHSVFCFLCVHKCEICPHCHVKYSDKSYLTYYELGDSNVEFIFMMVNRLQKENTRMPLFIKKIAAQNNNFSSKSTFEIGNSSKQTEFSDNTDDYNMMHIENNPNVINQVGPDPSPKSELFNDSDHENTSNEESTRDPPWNASPKKLQGKRKDKKHKIETNQAKVKVTKKALNVSEQKMNADVSNNCNQIVENSYSKTENEVQKECKNKMKNDNGSEEDSSLDQLFEELEKLGDQKYPDEHIGDKSSDVTNPENDSSNHVKVNGDIKLNGFEPKTKLSLEEELFGNKIENPNKVIPFVTKTYVNRSKNSSFHEKSSASIFEFDGTIDIECPRGTTFSDYKRYEVLKKDVLHKKPEKESDVKLEQGKKIEREKDTQDEIFEALFQDTKGRAKRKAALLKENSSSKKKTKDAANESSEPFNDVSNAEKADGANKEQRSKRTRKQLELNKNTSEIEDLIRSKKLKTENEATSDAKEEPKKFLKIETNVENESPDVHMKESEEELNQKEINRIICEDNEITLVSRNTRKRKNSKDDEGRDDKKLDTIGKTAQRIPRRKVTSECLTDVEVGNVDDIAKTVQTRPGRRKVTSECSTDVEVSKEKGVDNVTNGKGQTKRTKATSREVAKKNNIDESTLEDKDSNQAGSTNKRTKTSNNNGKNNEPTSEGKESTTEETAFEENHDKFTPKRIPNKRVMKKTALQDKDTPKSNSASSGSTGDYFTSFEETPLSINKDKESTNKDKESTNKDSEQSTPRTSRFNKVSSRDNGSLKTSQTEGLKLPDKVNRTTSSTPSMKNSSTTVVKNPSTLKKNPAIEKENPSTPAASSMKKNPTTPVSSVKKLPALSSMYKRNMKGETLLHTACKKDATKVLTLLKNSMTPNVKDNAGWTPLHDAVSIGNETVVRLLLDSGALVNVPGMDNDTPLHLAARNERPALGRLLIQYGADTELRNLQGYKPLEYFDVIGRPDLKAQILAARTLPSLASTTPAPLPPSCIDLVLYGEGLEKWEMNVLGRLAKSLTSCEQPIIVSTLLQSNVSTIIVRGTPDRLCSPTPNVLRAILSGIKAVDFSWVEQCLSESRVIDAREYEILGTVNYPQARPFLKSKRNNDNMLPGLFNGLQAYLSKPWSPSASLTQEDLRHLLKLGGASVLNREPDPESTNPNEATVLYHVTDPAHRLYRLSQAILYPEQAVPRRLYNMEHVKALGLAWFVACIEQYEIVEPKSLYDE
uniref:BRCA1-associated RING domain protein 1 n=1 Tax=Cacopsylla melanoneura TaxID=428564 RepID=A0A8D9EV80_9HEMI